MANYTITRQTEPDDIYGCTDFQTTETVEEMAVIGGGPNAVDGDIIWYIDANLGYTVNVDNFNIPSATPTAVPQIPFSNSPIAGYRTFEGGLIPAPILGVVFEQITLLRIKVTLFLVPDAVNGITGSVFSMPGNNISVQLPIEGCA